MEKYQKPYLLTVPYLLTCAEVQDFLPNSEAFLVSHFSLWFSLHFFWIFLVEIKACLRSIKVKAMPCVMCHWHKIVVTVTGCRMSKFLSFCAELNECDNRVAIYRYSIKHLIPRHIDQVQFILPVSELLPLDWSRRTSWWRATPMQSKWIKLAVHTKMGTGMHQLDIIADCRQQYL